MEQLIKHLENINMTNPSVEIQNKLDKHKSELNEIINKRIQFLIHRLRQENFDHGNKSGKYLANQIKRNIEKTTITALQDSAGNITHTPTEINQIFYNFYNRLYPTEIDPDSKEINHFLDNIDLPIIDHDQKKKIETPFSQDEYHAALKSMPNNRSPGPDGFRLNSFAIFLVNSSSTILPNGPRINSQL